jgi:hypothetical protein
MAERTIQVVISVRNTGFLLFAIQRPAELYSGWFASDIAEIALRAPNTDRMTNYLCSLLSGLPLAGAGWDVLGADYLLNRKAAQRDRSQTGRGADMSSTHSRQPVACVISGRVVFTRQDVVAIRVTLLWHKDEMQRISPTRRSNRTTTGSSVDICSNSRMVNNPVSRPPEPRTCRGHKPSRPLYILLLCVPSSNPIMRTCGPRDRAEMSGTRWSPP